MRLAKQTSDEEIRIIGSLSLVRDLVRSGDLDILRLIICPLALPETGVEPVFDGVGDIEFDLIGTLTLDDQIVIID